MNIPNIRLLNQQLLNPLFREPKELVSWMGAMQAQNYSMVKWAVGMRLKSATIQTVEKALREGEILRTHVMRPTWHLVAAEDIRWMLKLSAQRIISANDSFAKGYDLDIPNELYTKAHDLLEKILCGKKSMTKQEIAEHFTRSGIRMRIIPPCTFFYKHRVIITALSRQDIVIIKTCRFRMQMPFTEYSGLISCLLQAFRYIRMIRI